MQTPKVKRPFWSLFGCAPDIQRDALSFGTTIWHTYGDYIEDRLLNTKCLFAFHPDAIEHVLQQEHKRYRRDGLVYRGLKTLIGNGLTTSNGELWIRQRRLIKPYFQHSSIDTFIPIIVDETRDFLAEVQPNQVVDMVSTMNRLMLTISLKTLFASTSLDIPAFAETLRLVGPDLTAYMRLPFPPLSIPTARNRRLTQNMARLDMLIEHALNERRTVSAASQGDLIQALIELNDPQQARDELMTLIIAGYQTTALLLSFTWHLLAQHPESAQKLRAEIDLLGDQPLTNDHLTHLSYAKAVLMEALRLYPPSFAMMRQAVEPDSINGHEVIPGTLVVLSPYFTHRHPAFWNDPERFDPQRFLPGGTRPDHKFAYAPFGAGPHFCAGNHLAMLEALIALVMIAQRFEIRYANPTFRPTIQALAFTTMQELPMVFAPG